MRFDLDLRNNAEARRGYALAMSDADRRLEAAQRLYEALHEVMKRGVIALDPFTEQKATSSLAEWEGLK